MDSKNFNENMPNFIEKSGSSWKFWKKRRYVVAVLALLGFFNVYALRVNLSIAIVAMTELKNITANGTTLLMREFDWDTKTQGYILSSFFYGYITTQIIGGYLATRIGGKKVFAMGIGVTAALTLITPFLAGINVYLLLTVRVVEGIFEGVTYPCIHAIWSQWAPPLERSRLATIAFSGSYIGTVVSLPLCSYIATALGWPSIFYIFGTIGLIWCLAWLMIVADTPCDDKRITKEELEYITNSLDNKNSNVKVPWKAVLTSLPAWAITVSHFSENWGFYTLLTQLPKFMKNVLKFDLTNTGFASALPYLAMSIMMQFSGQFADWFQLRGILTTTQVRKIFNCGAFIAQTIFMMGAAYWLSTVGTTFCLTMAVGLGAFAWAGFSVNHLDIAPQHASVLMGLSNTFATLPGIVSPILSGYVVTNEESAEEWRIVFYISSLIYLFGAVFYGIFASGEKQPWADVTTTLVQNQRKNNTETKLTYDNKSFVPDQL